MLINRDDLIDFPFGVAVERDRFPILSATNSMPCEKASVTIRMPADMAKDLIAPKMRVSTDFMESSLRCKAAIFQRLNAIIVVMDTKVKSIGYEKPKIIFEDNLILVLNKPSGWIVNEAKTTTNQPVVQTWLRENFKYPIVNTTLLRSGVVHRLDKETSGILIVAKTKEAFENLQSQFKERRVEKTYVALVHGVVKSEEGKIEAPVGRLPWRRDRFGVLPGGREAVTDYRVISNFQFPISNEELTLLELMPKTGRTHQIRIHLKYIGHPIVSDEFYAGRKTARNDRKWCPRLFLHAKGSSFFHPGEAKELSFESNLPEDLDGALKNLDHMREKP